MEAALRVNFSASPHQLINSAFLWTTNVQIRYLTPEIGKELSDGFPVAGLIAC